MFSKIHLIVAGFVGGMLLVSAVALAQADKVIARVGDREITVSDLENAKRDIGAQFERLPEGRRQAALLDALIDIYVIADKAKSVGFDKNKSFVGRMALLRQRVLHNLYVSNTVSKKITDEEVKARYVAQTSKNEEVKARHILVKTEEEALAIVKQLDAGGDFVALAKEKSTGPSGANGGDLGFFGKGQMVPAFEKAAFALETGKHTSKPVKTQFGYHVIKVEARRVATPPPFDKVKSQFRQLILRERYGALVDETRKAIKVEILDENLRLPKGNGN
jgi:peptidyl-prolyl cis-trans isomerase C